MKVRYKGREKIEVQGRQYHCREIIDIEDFSGLPLNLFEGLYNDKPNVERKKIQEMMAKLDREKKDLESFYGDLKRREAELSKGKDTEKKTKKEVD